MKDRYANNPKIKRPEKIPKDILFFPGSFDPVHKGHVHLIEYLLEKYPNSQVAISPTPSPPHKNHDRAPLLHRFRMLRLALQNLLKQKRVCISLLEKSMPAPQYTFHTLLALEKRINHRPFLVMGDDQYRQLPHWYRGEAISKDYKIIVFKRDFPTLSKAYHSYHKVLNNPLWPESSSEVRDDSKWSLQFLPKSVLEYILRNKLYASD